MADLLGPILVALGVAWIGAASVLEARWLRRHEVGPRTMVTFAIVAVLGLIGFVVSVSYGQQLGLLGFLTWLVVEASIERAVVSWDLEGPRWRVARIWIRVGDLARRIQEVEAAGDRATPGERSRPVRSPPNAIDALGLEELRARLSSLLERLDRCRTPQLDALIDAVQEWNRHIASGTRPPDSRRDDLIETIRVLAKILPTWD